MKQKLLLLVLAIGYMHGLNAASAAGVGQPESIKVLSWNVLGDKARDVQEFYVGNLTVQQERIYRNMVTIVDCYQKSLDFICLQEMPQIIIQDLDRKGFAFSHINMELAANAEGSALYYNNLKYKQIDSKNLYIPTLDQQHKGKCAIGLFQSNNVPSQKILVVSVHFSRPNNRSGSADGLAQYDNLIRALQDLCRTNNQNLGELPFIIAGDFNTYYEEMMKDIVPMWEGIRMFEHSSFTVVKPKEPLFASIDHMLYQKLSIDMSKSYVGSGDYRDVRVPTALEHILDSTKRDIFSLVYFNTTGKKWTNRSDHLPVYAEFSTFGAMQKALAQKDQEGQQLAKDIDQLKAREAELQARLAQAKRQPTSTAKIVRQDVGDVLQDIEIIEEDLFGRPDQAQRPTPPPAAMTPGQAKRLQEQKDFELAQQLQQQERPSGARMPFMGPVRHVDPSLGRAPSPRRSMSPVSFQPQARQSLRARDVEKLLRLLKEVDRLKARRR
ncbi:hypothetical protein KBD08_03020 [Candidatus Babeliales bacterium]|nr:hypothetical protein [Candidatus Babeliales bacterium]